MGYMSEEKVIHFLKVLGERIRTVVEEFGLEDDLDLIEVRYASKTLGILDVADGFDDPENWADAECSLEELRNDPYLDVFRICEGEWYNYVYGYEARGTGKVGKALYDAFTDSAEDFDMTMDYYDRALGFQLRESWKKQFEEEMKD